MSAAATLCDAAPARMQGAAEADDSMRFRRVLRVLIVSESPIARRELQSVLETFADFEVATLDPSDPAASIAEPPDVVLDDGSEGAWAAGALVDLPTVVLGAEATGSPPPGESHLAADARPAQIAAALVAAAEGLVVQDPSLRPLYDERLDDGDRLTPRELEVLRLVAAGSPNRRIADELQVSEHTVKFHVSSILGKLQARSRTEAVAVAARRGLVAL